MNKDQKNIEKLKRKRFIGLNLRCYKAQYNNDEWKVSGTQHHSTKIHVINCLPNLNYKECMTYVHFMENDVMRGPALRRLIFYTVISVRISSYIFRAHHLKRSRQTDDWKNSLQLLPSKKYWIDRLRGVANFTHLPALIVAGCAIMVAFSWFVA